MIFNEEQSLIQQTARQYVAEKITPFAAGWDRNKTFPRDALNGLAQLGFYGMLVPEQWGGCDIGYTSAAIVLEEIAAGDAACSTIISVTNSVGCMPIFQFGDEWQKNEFLIRSQFF